MPSSRFFFETLTPDWNETGDTGSQPARPGPANPGPARPDAPWATYQPPPQGPSWTPASEFVVNGQPLDDNPAPDEAPAPAPPASWPSQRQLAGWTLGSAITAAVASSIAYRYALVAALGSETIGLLAASFIGSVCLSAYLAGWLLILTIRLAARPSSDSAG